MAGFVILKANLTVIIGRTKIKIFFLFYRELKTCKSKMDTQSKQVSEYANRMEDYDKKFEENSRKFGTLLAVSCSLIIHLNNPVTKIFGTPCTVFINR